MSRVLVVANETVGAEELLAEIRRIEDRRTSTFHVLAPAVADEHGLGTWNQEGAIQHAHERLDQTLGVLRSEGLKADGHVGDMVPLAAIEDALLQFLRRRDRDLHASGGALALAQARPRRAGAQEVRAAGRARGLACPGERHRLEARTE